jgi:hypothetical protein
MLVLVGRLPERLNAQFLPALAPSPGAEPRQPRKKGVRIMKNKLVDLNNHLFAQLERLGEESLTEEQIEQEAKRTDAIVSVAEQIIRNADLSLKAAHLIANHGDRFAPMLPMIEGKAEAADGRAK